MFQITSSFSGRPSVLALAAVLGASLSAPAQADVSRLMDLLAATPVGGWVQVNTGTLASAHPADGLFDPDRGFSVNNVVTPWSSFAWDSVNDSLLLWGGGHANYSGNEMYVWNAASGGWSLGSLPSRLVDGGNSSYYVVDNAAPQSSHTYDNNLFLPVNGMFMTLGGAVYNTGGNFNTATCTAALNCTDVQRAGPWLWRPDKADPSKVGGSTGSGYDTTSLGGNMWINRAGSLVGQQAQSYINGSTASRVEIIDGQPTDVVYLTSDSNASHLPGIYRYVVGDVAEGETDTIEQIGTTWATDVGKGAATLDSAHNLLVRTAPSNASALAVWDLSLDHLADPGANREMGVALQLADGSFLDTSSGAFGLDYDPLNDNFLLWDGAGQGRVWQVTAAFDADGKPLTTWSATALDSSNGSHPAGDFATGVLGKWKYVDELQAFMAMDSFDTATGDAGIWLYKPFSTATAVPDAPALWTLLAGLGLLAVRRRQAARAV